MPRYKVTVTMHETHDAEVEVEAPNLEAAKRLAVEGGSDIPLDDFERTDCWYEAGEVKEI